MREETTIVEVNEYGKPSLSFGAKVAIITGAVIAGVVVLLVANALIYRATHKDPLCDSVVYRADHDIDAACDLW